MPGERRSPPRYRALDGRLRHTYAIADGLVPHALLLRMAKDAGLRARFARLTWDELVRLGQAYPALAPTCQRQLGCRVCRQKNAAGEEAVEVLDPLAERRTLWSSRRQFFARIGAARSSSLKRSRALPDTPGPFGFRWFVPELLRQRRLFVDVAVAAIMLYALGLVVPIFFQLVIDKVLVHESFTTLYVLAVGRDCAGVRCGLQLPATLSAALCHQQGRHSCRDQDVRSSARPAGRFL